MFKRVTGAAVGSGLPLLILMPGLGPVLGHHAIAGGHVRHRRPGS